MALIIATGSNLGNSTQILHEAKLKLSLFFDFTAESRIYKSAAVEYLNQPDFYNQVLEFSLPAFSPKEVMNKLLEIEKDFGRNRDIPKGPRILDLDIIFWDLKSIQEDALIIPHPRWMERSFVVRPIQELPFFQTIEKSFTIPKTFSVDAFPIL